MAGTLRDAGYKSASMYMVEAKIIHIERGWEWTRLLDRQFKFCVKAANRGKGPPKKAPEVPEGQWASHSLLPSPFRAETSVKMAEHLFACGVHWMMREIEIANLRANDAKFDHTNRLVTLSWNESNMDQERLSVSRTLQCPCNGACNIKCPYAELEALTLQACLHGHADGALSMCHDGARATKAQIVADWRQFFGDTITGHSTRRSGALQYIHRGWSITQVAFLGRWKSNIIILEYAKEALQTIGLNADSNLFGTLSNMINQGKEPVEISSSQKMVNMDDFAQKEVVENLKELKWFISGTKATSNKLERSVQALEAKYKDYTKFLPRWVKSTRQQITHKNCKVFLCSPAPMWKTVCGWNY